MGGQRLVDQRLGPLARGHMARQAGFGSRDFGRQEKIADAETAGHQRAAGQPREEGLRKIQRNARAIADAFGRHAASMGDGAQGFVRQAQHVGALHAVLAGDETDAATAFVFRRVVQTLDGRGNGLQRRLRQLGTVHGDLSTTNARAARPGFRASGWRARAGC